MTTIVCHEIMHNATRKTIQYCGHHGLYINRSSIAWLLRGCCFALFCFLVEVFQQVFGMALNFFDAFFFPEEVGPPSFKFVFLQLAPSSVIVPVTSYF